MNLLRFRRIQKDLYLPDGRLVKVTIDDTHSTQHVEDGDRVHATGRLAPVAITVRRPAKGRRPLLLRGLGMPKVRQAWNRDCDEGLWAPVPPPPKELIHP